MQAMKNLLTKLVKDEQGGEVLEYALIAGLIVVAAIAIITSVGTKVAARWTSLLAFPMAILNPEGANMSTSLGISPIVAISSGGMPYAFDR